MARLWSCGFELQSNADLMEIQDLVPNFGPTISTTVKRAPGTASLRIQPTASNQYIEHQLTSGVVMRTFHRVYVRIAALPSAAANIYGIGQSGYFPGLLKLNTDGSLILRDGNAGTDLGTATAPLSLDRWYRIELDFTDVAGAVTAGVSAFKLYIDGELASNQMCTNINGFSRIRAGTTSAVSTLDMYLDDLAVNDDTGSVQNGLPGSGCIVHLYPDKAGDNNLWSAGAGGTAGAANNFTRVNQRTPDDLTSYNQTNAAGTTTTDDFGMQTAASAGIGSADLINVVSVGSRIGSDATATATIVTRIKSQANGTVVESASTSMALNGWTTHRNTVPRLHQLNQYVDPQAGGAWTPALLDTTQIGYRTNASQTSTRRVTGLWALVDLTPRFALGHAVAAVAARPLGYEKGNAPLVSLVDDFEDGVVDELKWPNSFGTYSEEGGRGRVAVAPLTYSALSTAKGYDLTGSSLSLEVIPSVMGDAAETAWSQILVKSVTEGTDLGFELRISTGEIIPFNRVGYFEAEAPIYPYDPVNHRWLRIREQAGQTFFDASATGHNWVNLRTISTPAYANDGDLEVQLIGYREDGTSSYVEFDNVNLISPQVVSVGRAATNNTARALRPVRRVPVAPGSSQALGRAVLARKIDPRSTPARTRDTATPLVSRSRFYLGHAVALTTARATSPLRRVPVGPASVVNAARAVSWLKVRTLGRAVAPTTARPLTPRKAGAIDAASSVHSGSELAALKTTRTGPAQSADSAREIVAVKTGLVAHAVSLSTANPVRVRKSTVVGAAATETISRGLVVARRAQVAPGHSQALGWPVLHRRTAHLGTARESSRAYGPGHQSFVDLGSPVEVVRAQPVTAHKLDPRPTPAQSVNAASGITPAKLKRLDRAASNTVATLVRPTRTVTATRTRAVDTAAGVSARKRDALGSTNETALAHPLTIRKLRTIGRATDRARALGAHPSHQTRVEAAQTQNRANAVSPLRTVSIASMVLTESGGGVAVSKRRTVGAGTTHSAALGVTSSKRVVIGSAEVSAAAGQIQLTRINRLVVTAPAVDRARSIVVKRQRPGTLKTSSAGPSLTVEVVPYGTRASTSGPNLSTGG